MSTIRSHSFSVSSAVAMIGCSTPALLKAKSRRPNVSTVLVQSGLHVLGPRHVAPDRERPPAGLLDHAGRFLVALLRNIGDHHAGALARERQRRGAADAVRCPGHERDLPGETSFLVRQCPAPVRFARLTAIVEREPDFCRPDVFIRARPRSERPRPKRIHLRYCSSLTCSIQSTASPSSVSWMAMWVMGVVGVRAPLGYAVNPGALRGRSAEGSPRDTERPRS